MEQYLTHTNHALWEVIVNGDAPVAIASVSGGVEAAIPPKTTKQKIARRNKLKAKSTLLLTIPDEHLLKSEGLDKTHDRSQKLISQLEIHDEVISHEDANRKLLRSLPSAWNTHTLIIRNKSDLDTLSMDDLYNILKVHDAEIKSQPSSSLNSHNVAFVSLDNTSSTNEAVNTPTHDVSVSSSQGQDFASTYVDDVMFSFFANQFNSTQLDNEDLEKIDINDLKEIDLKWQKLLALIRQRLNVITATMETLANALVVTDGMGYDWVYQVEEGPTDFALMAHLSSGSSSSGTEVHTCSKECLQSNKTLQKQYDQQCEILNKANLEIIAYQFGLESLEARIVVHQNNEAVFEEDIVFLKYDVKVRDNSITKLKNQLEESSKEKDDLKLKLEKFKTSSKNLTNLINSQISLKDKTGLGYDSQLNERDLNNIHMDKSEGYHAVPPPYTGNFMPSRPDLSFARLDYSIFKSAMIETVNSMHETKTSASKTSKENMEKPKTVRSSAPLIEEWESDSDDDFATKSGQVPVNTAKQSSPRAAASIIVSTTKRNGENVVKSSTCWIWIPTRNVIDHISKDNGSYMLKRCNYVDLQGILKSAMAWVPKRN
nr:hypothetical protein [Tanacetum cinerariifolium]